MATNPTNWAETLVGTAGIYRKVPTPDSVDTSECRKCALREGQGFGLCPRRGNRYEGTSLNCVDDTHAGLRMRFIWALGVLDFTHIDEGGTV